MKEIEVTVFVYSEDPFEAHISEEAVNYGVNETNVHKIFSGYEKPQKGIVVKFKYQDGSKKFVRSE
ncbi:hypothetical protein OF820_02155 [Oceanotoga sp. DSM 15011]|jgi:hypothetical protein|uniref:Uncharacterized protein n=1 Tax=Oceanotoga teriensis TaxID=515440 RepID=A0AA45C5W3_9BACT|nr:MULTISPECIES: hypothetical protein [Oceanotoga]MDN5341464.1 hypothetical protein [Oceanotoga sp.]MDO7977632.1 hypothetical protein [Oceanotoga teriensis]PWJ90079.1 hypothetical protein C7380_11368 [Oceanotoga teriensis]UYP00495.1 hypothetical protein OF820_02155 [Oceanotoga sp. DSM 15011]